MLFVQRGFWPQPEKHSLFHFNVFSTTLYHSALTAGVLRYHECVWEVPLRPRKHQHVCAACARLNVYNVHLCLCLTDVSRPNLSLRRLARSLPPSDCGVSILSFSPGGRGRVEVAAVGRGFWRGYSRFCWSLRKTSFLEMGRQTQTTVVRVGSFFSLQSLNREQSFCKSPPAFCFSAMSTCTPTLTHKH